MAISCCGNDLLARFRVSFEDRCNPSDVLPDYVAPQPTQFYPEIIKVSGIELGEEGTIEVDDDYFTAKIADGILTAPTISLEFKADTIPANYTPITINVNGTDTLFQPTVSTAFGFFHYWAYYRHNICRNMYVWITGRDCTSVKFVYRFNGITMTKLPALGDKEKKSPGALIFSVSFEQSQPPELLSGIGVNIGVVTGREYLFASNGVC